MEHPIEVSLRTGARVRVVFLAENIARVSYTQDGEFTDTGLNRYGFILGPERGDLEIDTQETADRVVAASPSVRIELAKSTGRLSVARADGTTVFEQLGAEFAGGKGVARFRADPDEDWIGFGDQTRERLYHRGRQVDLRVTNVTSYAPVPFFMSTRGYAVLINTTHRVVCDMCKADPDHFTWRDDRGVVDYYVMAGGGFRELIFLYTDLTGKPKLPPLWAFGLWYICRTQANDFEAVSDAHNFRREEIPCDVLGLEPGWMEKSYDLSTDKCWSTERFPIPSYCVNGPHNFFNAIQRMGFHMELWLANEYDLSYEAERWAKANTTASDGAPSAQYHENAEVDEHFAGARRVDQITDPEKPWFEHLKKFVDQGIDFFKQDGAFQVLEHPDRVWGNGMLDAEMHNLYPLLYARQMYEGFAEHTGRRPVVFTCAGWAGFQAWCGTWTGDTGGRLDTLGGMLNTATVGHSWATNDMEVAEKEGVHFGYLQPWSQINSWNYFRMPWLQGPELSAMHRYYGRLRSRLIPYIYSWARQSTLTGYPLMAPLTLEYPDDAECREVLSQYLLGRDLMVVIYKRNAYFPAGKWRDFWTGEIIEGGRWREIDWPQNRGGGLFVRAGGIVPMGPVMQYRGEKPVDPIEAYIFPDTEQTTTEFYEDDGVTLKHQDGEWAVTVIRAHDRGDTVTIEVEETHGSFDGQCERRKWGFTVAAEAPPASVSANGELLAADGWDYDESRRAVKIPPMAGPLEILISRNKGKAR